MISVLKRLSSRPVVFKINKNLRISCDFSTSNHHKTISQDMG